MELKQAPDTLEQTPEEKATQNQLGVIQVVERLFNGINAGSFPLKATDDVMAGMNFLAQFHKQLVAQLPEDLKAKIKAETEARNGPQVA
jgi:hypothetical protein